MTRLSAILLLIFTCVGISTLHAQPDTTQPYLYYYSQLLGGLIIEHPDGTDSRQIAADVIPPNMTGLSGPGWSPSGKYFAAYNFIAQPYRSGTDTPYIIDLQGYSIASKLTTSIINTLYMQWSPSGTDVLLIVGLLHPDYETSFWLVDVAQDKVIATFTTPIEDLLSYSITEVLWDVNQQQIMFYVRARLVKEVPLYRVTMHFDGKIERQEVLTNDGLSALVDTITLEDADALIYGKNTSPSGIYTAYGLHPPKLIDNRTGKTIDLPVHTQATICRDYLWTSDEVYTITLDGTLLAGGGCASAAMGVTNPQGTLWRELGRCSWDHPPCIGWLPSNVDLQALPSGSSKPIQLDPTRIDYDRYAETILPSKEHPLKWFCDANSTAVIRDTKSRTDLYTLVHIECPYNPHNNLIASKGIPVAAAEDPSHQLLATYTNYSNERGGVMIWKLGVDNYQPILRLNTLGLQLEFTPDNQYLRARNYNGWKVYSVADILASVKPQ